MRRNGFTLIELLVVVVIIAAAAVAVTPAVTSVIASNNETGAVNRVSSALANARALAVQNGRITGVAFRLDPVTERSRLVLIEDTGETGTYLNIGPEPKLAVFRPVPGTKEIDLPPSVIIAGLSNSTAGAGEPTAFNSTDYRTGLPGTPLETALWYAGMFGEDNLTDPPPAGQVDELFWIFPRDDARIYLSESELAAITDEPGETFWNSDDIASNRQIAVSRHASTFVLLFNERGTPVRTVSRSTQSFETFYIEYDDAPLNLSTGDRNPIDNATAAGIAFDPEVALGNTNFTPNDEYVCQAVLQIAVTDLARLRRGTSIERPWHVHATQFSYNSDVSSDWRFITSDARASEISQWIDNNAVILGINPVSGQVVRRSEP